MGLPTGLGVPVDTPHRMPILHPKTGRPLVNKDTGEEAYVDLYSADSEKARAHQRSQINKRLSRRNRSATTSAEEIEASGIDTLVALTAGWHLVTLDGEPIPDFPYTPDNARELYAAPEMAWLRKQVDDFAGEIGNFVTDSSTNS